MQSFLPGEKQLTFAKRY